MVVLVPGARTDENGQAKISDTVFLFCIFFSLNDNFDKIDILDVSLILN